MRKSRYQNIIHIKKEKSFFLNSELKLAGTTRNYFKKMCHVLWEQFCCSYKYTKAARNRSQLFKGYYLRCKTITCDKMCHLKHRLRIFLFHRKIMFHSQDIQVFVFLTIPWFTKSVTSQWVLVHETRCIFEYIFWTTNHEVTKLGQLIDISKYNNFQ